MRNCEEWNSSEVDRLEIGVRFEDQVERDVSGYTLGNFIYVLLVIALVLFLVRLISGRRVV